MSKKVRFIATLEGVNGQIQGGVYVPPHFSDNEIEKELRIWAAQRLQVQWKELPPETYTRSYIPKEE